jgi:hypothetical protein
MNLTEGKVTIESDVFQDAQQTESSLMPLVLLVQV